MNYEQYQNYQSAYQALYQKTPRGKYAFHKSSAKKRGIPFLLTFEEWWDIWQASGKWEQRGRRRDQYVMARFGDLGAYKRDNVRICLAGENTDEMRQGLPPRWQAHSRGTEGSKQRLCGQGKARAKDSGHGSF
jgi:hypothetical protein